MKTKEKKIELKEGESLGPEVLNFSDKSDIVKRTQLIVRDGKVVRKIHLEKKTKQELAETDKFLKKF